MINNKRNNRIDWCFNEIERAIFIKHKPCLPIWCSDQGIEFRTQQMSLLNDPVLARIKPLQDVQWHPLSQETNFDHDVGVISDAIHSKVDSLVFCRNIPSNPTTFYLTNTGVDRGAQPEGGPDVALGNAFQHRGQTHRNDNDNNQPIPVATPYRRRRLPCVRSRNHVTCRVNFDIVNTDHVTYHIRIYLDDGNGNVRSGVVNKRYSDLYAMHQSMLSTQNRNRIPTFPKKTFLKCTNVGALNIRAEDLSDYFQGLLNAGLQNERHFLNLIANMTPLVLNRDRFENSTVRVEECRKVHQEEGQHGNYLEYKFEIEQSGTYWIRFSELRALHLRLCSTSRHRSRLKRLFPWRTLFPCVSINSVAKRMRDMRNYMVFVLRDMGTHQRLVMEFLDAKNDAQNDELRTAPITGSRIVTAV